MQKIILLLSAVAGIVAVFIAFNTNDSKAAGGTKAPDSVQLVKRGEYLVTTIGCDDCHSPKRLGPQGPVVDAELRFSGYPASRPVPEVDTQVIKIGWILFGPDLTAAVGPWGATFSANITSDATGIGKWSETQFIKAIREAKLKGLDGNRPIMPPMPWQNLKKLNDNDLKSIFAYLKTTKPVDNVVPSFIPFKDLKVKRSVRRA